MASLLDPLGLLPRTATAARLGIRVAGWTGKQAVQLGRTGIGALAQDGQPARALGAGPSTRSAPKADPPAPKPDSLQQKLGHLLDRALDQSTSSGQAELFHRIIDQLVPDEARIISALSDGSVSPLVNVRAISRTGTPGKVLLENVSLVGRTANLALPRLTPNYVTHLMTLGLVEVGPERPALKTDYEVLLAETYVLKAIKAAGRGPLAGKVERRTLQLSTLGRSLWEAAAGGGQ